MPYGSLRLVLLATAVVLTGCSKKAPVQRNTVEQPAPVVAPVASSPQNSTLARWTGIAAKVKDLKGRQQKILDVTTQAYQEFEKFEVSEKAGAPKQEHLEKARELKLEADDIYDNLTMDIDRSGGRDAVDLWETHEREFRRAYERVAKPISRIHISSKRFR